MAFVGRERELVHLAGALQRAAGGETTRVALRASGGLGMTRLITELDKKLADIPGITVARGTAYEPLGGVAYSSLSAALTSALAPLSDTRLKRVVGPAAEVVAPILPDLGERLAALGVGSVDRYKVEPEQHGSRLAEAVIRLLERLAGDGAVLLALEDMHFADPGTAAFVRRLLRVSRQMPVCLVVGYDPEEVSRRHPMRPLLEEVRAAHGMEVLSLRPWTRDEVAVYLEEALGERPSASFLAAVLEGSGGIPLVVEHLVEVHRTRSGMRLSEPLDDLVRSRLADLPRGVVRTLGLLAAARRPLPRATLLEVPLPDGEVAAPWLDEAVASGLAMAADDDSVGIAHLRVAEALESFGLPRDQLAAHRALAWVLRHPAEAAWHWEAAMDSRAALVEHLSAATRAEGVDPAGTALLHLQRALEFTGLGGGSGESAGGAGAADSGAEGSADDAASVPALLARAAKAAALSGAYRRAAAFCRQAIDQRTDAAALLHPRAHHTGLPSEALFEIGELHQRLGHYQWESGDMTPALAAFETAMQIVPEVPTRQRARALATYAQYLMLDGRFGDSAAIAQDARRAARVAGDGALAEYGHATCTLGVDVAYAGELERGLAFLQEAGAIARKVGRIDDLMRSFANRTTLLERDSRRDEALRVVAKGLEEARRANLEDVYGSMLRGNAADCLFALGRWADAERECRAALEWSLPSLEWFHLILSEILVESQADEEATRELGGVILQLESVPAGQWTAIVQRCSVSLALWRGDTDEALDAAQRGWDRVLETDDWSQVALAASTTLEACAAAAEHARARRDFVGLAAAGEIGARVLEEAERRVAGSGAPEGLGSRREAELHLDMARAHHERVHGRADPLLWGRLARAWGAIPVPYQAAKARWWEGAAILQHDPNQQARPSARRALVEADRIGRDLGAAPLRRAIAELASRARITLPAAARERPRPAAPAQPARPRAPIVDINARRAPVAIPIVWPGEDEPGVDGSWSVPQARPAGVIRALPPIFRNATTSAIEERIRQTPAETGRDPFGLSPREAEVLNVLAEGRTNREIAERLFISERTVGVHVRRILMKLGVAGRVEATSVAIRLGLVQDLPTLPSVFRGQPPG
jgi:DNA-binding CsgD family transcriptional regulator/tetratricopeptide (TPR) repeat protein